MSMRQKSATKKIRLSFDHNVQLLKWKNIHTVCEESSCPNRYECSQNGVATYLIGGRLCTRLCKFCDVTTSKPTQKIQDIQIVEEEEIIRSVLHLNNKYVVITSVARDDEEVALANHFSSIIQRLNNMNVYVESLIPDFHLKKVCLDTIGNAQPLVIGHNIETVERLSKQIRPQAGYHRSLKLYQYLDVQFPHIIRKAGMMVGLGETIQEVKDTLYQLKQASVDIVTIGQYLRPSSKQIGVQNYWEDQVFTELESYCQELNFLACAVGPFVRSSYMAQNMMQAILSRRVK